MEANAAKGTPSSAAASDPRAANAGAPGGSPLAATGAPLPADSAAAGPASAAPTPATQPRRKRRSGVSPQVVAELLEGPHRNSAGSGEQQQTGGGGGCSVQTPQTKQQQAAATLPLQQQQQQQQQTPKPKPQVQQGGGQAKKAEHSAEKAAAADMMQVDGTDPQQQEEEKAEDKQQDGSDEDVVLVGETAGKGRDEEQRQQPIDLTHSDPDVEMDEPAPRRTPLPTVREEGEQGEQQQQGEQEQQQGEQGLGPSGATRRSARRRGSGSGGGGGGGPSPPGGAGDAAAAAAAVSKRRRSSSAAPEGDSPGPSGSPTDKEQEQKEEDAANQQQQQQEGQEDAAGQQQQEPRRPRPARPGPGGGGGGGARGAAASPTDLGAEIAAAVGLPPLQFSEEELDMGLGDRGYDDEQYCDIRNHVLACWRYDPTRYLTADVAARGIWNKYLHMVAPAWEFLDRYGYINFGVAPAITDRGVPERKESVVIIGAGLAGVSAARQLRNWGYRVVVLEGQDRLGGRVYGKRMEGTAQDGTHQLAVADLGGSIITGIDGNPLAVLARQLGLPMHAIEADDVPLYHSDGSMADENVDAQVYDRFNEMLDRTYQMREELPPAVADAISLEAAVEGMWARARRENPEAWDEPPVTTASPESGTRVTPAAGSSGGVGEAAAGTAAGEGGSGGGKTGEQQQPPSSSGARLEAAVRAAVAAAAKQQAAAKEARLPVAARLPPAELRRRLMHWHMANVEFANASKLGALSMRYWDLDDEYEFLGPHVFLPGGNLRLVAALARDIPILYRCQATLVEYSTQGGVVVHTDTAGRVAADACIVTVPLGALKRGVPAFSPPLPARKRAAVRRLGFGVLNKVMMLFPACFWGQRDMFGHVQPDPSRRGAYYLFYAYEGVSGGPVLAALVAGQAAEDLESLKDEEAVAQVVGVLRGIFGPQGVEVPDPLQAVVTRWGKDPLTWGSYSSVPVGCPGPDDYEAMASPLGGRVFFAGEATIRKYPATMHGAFLTGLREAARAAVALTAAPGEQQEQQQQQQRSRRSGSRAGGGSSAAATAAAIGAKSATRRGKENRDTSRGGGGGSSAPAGRASSAVGPSAGANAAAQRLEELSLMVAEIFGPSAVLPADDAPNRPRRASARQRGAAAAASGPPLPVDLELGSIRAVYGPAGSEFENEALVAVEVQSGTAAGLQAFGAVSRAQLEDLEDTPGGDEARVAAVKRILKGRSIGGDPRAGALAAAIHAVRRHKAAAE